MGFVSCLAFQRRHHGKQALGNYCPLAKLFKPFQGLRLPLSAQILGSTQVRRPHQACQTLRLAFSAGSKPNGLVPSLFPLSSWPCACPYDKPHPFPLDPARWPALVGMWFISQNWTGIEKKRNWLTLLLWIGILLLEVWPCSWQLSPRGVLCWLLYRCGPWLGLDHILSSSWRLQFTEQATWPMSHFTHCFALAKTACAFFLGTACRVIVAIPQPTLWYPPAGCTSLRSRA